MTFSTGLLLSWLIRDLRDIEPEYVDKLWGRLQTSICDYPDLLRSDLEGEYDGYVPFHNHDGSDILFWAHEEVLADLYATLFPFNLKDAALGEPALSLVVVGIHGALEAYVKSVGISVGGGLPEAIRTFLESRAPPISIDSRTFDVLADADASRHIIVHNRGVVDDKYVRRVRNSPFAIGERRTVKADDVDSFGRAIMEVAQAIHRADQHSPAT